jgi:hypothetical protein
MTLDEDRAERVKQMAEAMELQIDRIHWADPATFREVTVFRMMAAEFIRLEDEIRALKDEVRQAASLLRDR